MRKGRDGGKKRGKNREKTDDYSGHYVIASSLPPERRPLERRPLVPIYLDRCAIQGSFQSKQLFTLEQGCQYNQKWPLGS